LKIAPASPENEKAAILDELRAGGWESIDGAGGDVVSIVQV
jgi:hypothetical protein